MTISVDINEVLRDFIGKLKKTYTKYTGKDPIEPIDSFELERYFTFDDEEESIDNFLYEESSLEIFGHSDEIKPNTISHLNNLNSKIKELGHKLEIVGIEIGNSKPSTLFFLSKTGCKVDRIRFVSTPEEMWEESDIIVTANPNVINSKPKDKNVIKVDSQYNQTITKFDYNVEKIKDIIDQNIIEKLSGSITIEYTDINEKG
jgi:hypothetical protein